MRCPYCGGINPDRSSFCASCGRDLTAPARPAAGRQPAQPPPYQEPSYYQPNYQRPVPPAQGNPPAGQRTAAARQAAPVSPSQSQAQAPRSIPNEPPVPPDAPAAFPPRTLNDLQTLEQGALAYTVTETTTTGKRKKIVHIVYPRCVAWQQVATLFRAWKEQQEARFESIVIDGYHTSDASEFSFTNGQLTFDRNVHLGSQTLERYLIETGNGYASDSVRIVLAE